VDACRLAHGTPLLHVPVVVFMSDGHAIDAAAPAEEFLSLNKEICPLLGNEVELHVVIEFGSRTYNQQLQHIAHALGMKGKVHTSTVTAELSNLLVDTGLLEAKIGKQISNAVTNKL
jgi:hypothetical protein